MKKIICIIILIFASSNAFSSNIFPTGFGNNSMYYKLGGSSDYTVPPVNSQTPINIQTSANLGIGKSCSAINPVISISNTMNQLKDSADNIDKMVLASATAAVTALPMYELSKHNPALYSLLNGKLLSATETLKTSIKSCEVARDEIDRGVNPYHEWGSISVNDDWSKKLSLSQYDSVDINEVKSSIDKNRGDSGVPWVTNGGYAGGKGMIPIRVVYDTAFAGYNAIIGRKIDTSSPPDNNNLNDGLVKNFKIPSDASEWIVHVVGDQHISTCNDTSCINKQSNDIGHGLLTMLTDCKDDKTICTNDIQSKIGDLVSGNKSINKNNLEDVSTDGVVISPEAILSIQRMDNAQKGIIISKLSQEIAMQRLIDKAFVAKNILSAGAQIPVIASNEPAQKIIQKAINDIDNDIKSIIFESQMRKQLMSDTLSQVMAYSQAQEINAMNIAPIQKNQKMMDQGAIISSENKS